MHTWISLIFEKKKIKKEKKEKKKTEITETSSAHWNEMNFNRLYM